MDCKGLKERIMPYLYGELDENERNLIKKHLSGCPNCQREINELKGAKALLDKKETPLPAEETLMTISSFAEANIARREKIFMGFSPHLAAGMAAAVVLLFLALFPLLTHPPVPGTNGISLIENGITSDLAEIEAEIALLQEEHTAVVHVTFRNETNLIEKELGKLSMQIEGNDFL